MKDKNQYFNYKENNIKNRFHDLCFVVWSSLCLLTYFALWLVFIVLFPITVPLWVLTGWTPSSLIDPDKYV